MATDLSFRSLHCCGQERNSEIALYGNPKEVKKQVSSHSTAECTLIVHQDDCEAASVVDMDPTSNQGPAKLPETSKAAADAREEFNRDQLFAYFSPLGITTDAQATTFISSIDQIFLKYHSMTRVDSQMFASRLVSEAQRSLCVLLSAKLAGERERSEAGEDASKCMNRKSVVRQLKKLLLKSPRELLSEYRNCASSSVNVEEQVKELELQILLRLEMISSDEGGMLEMPHKDQLVKDICKILDRIQFYLDGGIFGSRGLVHYCNQLVKRYKETHARTITKIFSIMELNGYGEDVTLNSTFQNRKMTSSKLPSNPRDILLSDVDGAAGNPMSGHQAEDCSSKAQGVQESSRSRDEKAFCDKGAQVGLHLLDSCPKKGSYHFASGASKLLRMKKIKLPDKSVARHSKPFRMSDRSRRLDKSGVPTKDSVQIVCQTPNINAKSCGPQIRCGADDVSQPLTLVPLKEFRAYSPVSQKRLGGEQASFSVELPSFLGKNKRLVGKVSKYALDERLAKISRKSGLVSNSPATCRLNIDHVFSRSLAESCERPALSTDFAKVTTSPVLRRARYIRSQYPQLLRSSESMSPKVGGRNLGPCLKGDLNHHNDDEDEDDDDINGILSTPFKVNPASQSCVILPSRLLEFDDFCNHRPAPHGLPPTEVFATDGNIVSECKHPFPRKLSANLSTAAKETPTCKIEDEITCGPDDNKENQSMHQQMPIKPFVDVKGRMVTSSRMTRSMTILEMTKALPPSSSTRGKRSP